MVRSLESSKSNISTKSLVLKRKIKAGASFNSVRAAQNSFQSRAEEEGHKLEQDRLSKQESENIGRARSYRGEFGSRSRREEQEFEGVNGIFQTPKSKEDTSYSREETPKEKEPQVQSQQLHDERSHRDKLIEE